MDVFCLCLDGGGSGGTGPAAAVYAGELAAATLAASAALAHAGVALRDLVCACSLARVVPGGDAVGGASAADPLLLLDPLAAELVAARGVAFVAAMPSCEQVTSMQLGGAWPPDALEEAIELALDGCRSLDVGLRNVLQEAVAAERVR